MVTDYFPNGRQQISQAIVFDDSCAKAIANMPDGTIRFVTNPGRPSATEDLIWGASGVSIGTLSGTVLINGGTSDSLKIQNSSGSPWAIQILNTAFSSSFGSAVRMFQDTDGTYRIFGPGGELVRLGTVAGTNSTFLGSQVNVTATAPVLNLDGTGVTSATLQYNTNSVLRWRVTVPSGSTDLRFNDGTSDILTIANQGAVRVLTGVAAGATIGDFILANGKGYKSANAASSTTRFLVHMNGSNQVVLAADGDDILWGRATVALGGGAAPTLGTIGGSGPAAAGQTAWLRVIDSGGTARFIPIWT